MNPYRFVSAAGYVICSTRAEHAAGLEKLQQLVFPTLSRESLFRAPDYLEHIRLFPEGQFVALSSANPDAEVIGMTTTLLHHLDPDSRHTFNDIIRAGFAGTHEPQGDWMYGLDIGTHPACRGSGIAKLLYDARQDTVEKLNLKGQYTYGMLTGYGAEKNKMTAAVYYEELISGKRKDPTVSRQMANGFAPMRLVPGYVEDPVCDGYCVLLVRKNPNYHS